MITEDQIKNTITALLGIFTSENDEKYSEIVNSIDSKDIEDVEEYHFLYVYKFQEFLETVVRNKVSVNNDVNFIYNNYAFLEHHIKTMISENEGSPCSADKSRFIINKLLQFYKTGDDIVIDYSQEYTYHLPKTILNTHEEIVLYYEALKSLYYGHHAKYVMFLKNIYNKLSELRESKNEEES